MKAYIYVYLYRQVFFSYPRPFINVLLQRYNCFLKCVCYYLYIHCTLFFSVKYIVLCIF